MSKTTKPAAGKPVRVRLVPAHLQLAGTPVAPVAPPTVALRGGQAVATVQVAPGVAYRTKAPHNMAWWQSLQVACTAAPAPVAVVCRPTAQGGHGVPAHFVGYCL